MVDTVYQDLQTSSHRWQRRFSADLDPQLLVWHRDHHSRRVCVLEGQGWQFQFDNQLPQPLEPGVVIDIPAEVYHRVIKGSGSLLLEIVEIESSYLESHPL